MSSSIISAFAFFRLGYSILFSASKAAYSCFSDWTEGSFFKPRLSKNRFAAWEKSFFYMPTWAFRLTILLAVLSDFLICAALFTTLESGDQYMIVILVAALFVYSWYRLKANKVNLSDLERAKEEAEKAARESV